jgi:hypothetical protein
MFLDMNASILEEPVLDPDPDPPPPVIPFLQLSELGSKVMEWLMHVNNGICICICM